MSNHTKPIHLDLHVYDNLKNHNTNTNSPLKSTESSARLLLTCSSKCMFCEGSEISNKYDYFPQMVNKALYLKYSSSQNYYYAKTINEILTNAKTPNTISFKDYRMLGEEEEQLRRFYRKSEHRAKLSMLSEYYKYHKDIPRMFMLPITINLNIFHDEKRRLDYARITKMLNERGQPSKTAQTAEDKKLESPHPITDRVLVDLEPSIPVHKKFERKGTLPSSTTATAREASERIGVNTSPRHKDGPYGIGSPGSRNGAGRADRVEKAEKANKGNTKKTGGTQAATVHLKVRKGNNVAGEQPSHDVSKSQTLHELNMKLGEIITNSYSQTGHLDALNYFDTSQQLNETNTNLEKFLKHIQSHNQQLPSSVVPKKLAPVTPVTPVPTLTKGAPQIIRSTVSIERSPSPEFKPKMENRSLVTLYANQHAKPTTIVSSRLNKQSSESDVRKTQPPAESSLYTRQKRTISIFEGTRDQDFDGGPFGLSPTRTGPHTHTLSMGQGLKGKAFDIGRIRNFEEAINERRQNSPFRATSQQFKSQDEEKIQANQPIDEVPFSLSSRRVTNSKTHKPQDERVRDILGLKRKTEVSIQTAAKHTAKNSIAGNSVPKEKETPIANVRSVYNTWEKNTDSIQVHNVSPRKLSIHGQSPSHQEIRAAIEAKIFHQNMKPQRELASPLYGREGDRLKKKDFRKTPSGTLINSGTKLGTPKVAPLRNLATISQIDSLKNDIKGVINPPLSKHLSNSTAKHEYSSVNNVDVIPETSASVRFHTENDHYERGSSAFYAELNSARVHTESGKYDKGATRLQVEVQSGKPYAGNGRYEKASAGVRTDTQPISFHKYTKSEDKMLKLKPPTFSKKGSLPYAITSRGFDQIGLEKVRKEPGSFSARQVYTFAQNHVDNTNFYSEHIRTEPDMSAKNSVKRQESGSIENVGSPMGRDAEAKSAGDNYFKTHGKSKLTRTDLAHSDARIEKYRQSSLKIFKKEDLMKGNQNKSKGFVK